LEILFNNTDVSITICLFIHLRIKTKRDRVALDGIKIDHATLDVHIGSISVKRYFEKQQPYITMHDHIHESTRLAGIWMKKNRYTICFQGTSESHEMSVIVFDLENPEKAVR